MKPRIAILTCNNTKQDLYCGSTMCLHSMRECAGGFACYRATGGAELIGLVTCDGCPTLAAPQRIIKRVKGLVDLGVDAIHLSSCMMAACPYRGKYMSILQEAFPQVKIVAGTHMDEGVAPEAAAKMFQESIRPMLSAVPQTTMSDVAIMLYPNLFPKRAAQQQACACEAPREAR